VSQNPGKTPPRVTRQPSWLSREFQDHARAIRSTLSDLARKPLSALLTAFVVGITLALPAGFHTLLSNMDVASSGLEGSLRASLFLKDSVSTEQGQILARSIGTRNGVSSAHYISRAEALAEFKANSGFGDALAVLRDNPLPAVVIVTPDTHSPQADIDQLFKQLSSLPEVEQAQIDKKWLQRLYSILGLVERVVFVVAAALALAVVIIIGNTVRLDIENHRDSIEVMMLIGAEDRFIRRPFLYTGLWYGIAGAILAVLLVEGARLSLASPASQLADLYGTQVALRGVAPEAALAMLLAGIGLGWIGAFWTVSRHLHRIDPV